jgi:hypothetical protein
MRIWILLAAVACLLALASSPAEAKYSTESLTIDGPGMDSPGVIESRRLIDRIYSATLVGTQRAKIAPPVQPGPAFFLEFEFGVADEDGARTETVDQIVYPFAQGGAVLRTTSGQGFDMSYGPVRFRPGWFVVPRNVLRLLEGVGLPRTLTHAPPSNASMTVDRPGGSRVPATVIAAVVVGALVLLVRQRRRGSGS